MNQYKDYRYADSDRLNFAGQKAEQEASAQVQETELLRQLEEGEISQAEYNTLSSTTKEELQFDAAVEFQAVQAAEAEIADSLTPEDYQYLNLK